MSIPNKMIIESGTVTFEPYDVMSPSNTGINDAFLVAHHTQFSVSAPEWAWGCRKIKSTRKSTGQQDRGCQQSYPVDQRSWERYALYARIGHQVFLSFTAGDTSNVRLDACHVGEFFIKKGKSVNVQKRAEEFIQEWNNYLSVLWI